MRELKYKYIAKDIESHIVPMRKRLTHCSNNIETAFIRHTGVAHNTLQGSAPFPRAQAVDWTRGDREVPVLLVNTRGSCAELLLCCPTMTPL